MSRKWVVGVLLALAVLLLAGRFLAAAYTDFHWFAALGAEAVWLSQLENRLILGAGSAVLASAFFFANLYAVRQSVVSLELPRKLGNLEIREEVPGKYLTQLALGVSLVFGILLAIPRERWLELAAARHSTPFSERDPYFSHDLSFFVNWLPLEMTLFNWALFVLVAAFVLVMLLYALTPSLRWEKSSGLHVTLYVRRHTGVLSACALVILAWSFRIDMFESLLHGSGPAGAFVSADKTLLTAGPILTFVTLLAAFLLVWATWTDQVRFAFICVGLVLLFSVAAKGAMPVIVRQSASSMDLQQEAQSRDYQFMATRAGATRRAFAVSEVLPATPPSAFTFPDWRDAARGISMWDPTVFAAAAVGSTRGGEVVGEAAFGASPDGQIVSVVIRAVSGASSSAPASWSTYSAFSGRSRPDGAPRGTGADNDVRPLHRVLVTEPAPAFVITTDSTGVIRAPEINSRLSRLAHAWSRQDFRMLFDSPPAAGSRILMHAGVKERIGRLVPFFILGASVHPLVHMDTLHWAVQLYSHSATYPLSQPVAVRGTEHRYFRHAGTALVNASTGDVRIFAVNAGDPLVDMWIARFPALFTPREDLPSQLAVHLPPAVDGALAQATAYARFGARYDSVFGGSLPTDASADSTATSGLPALTHLTGIEPVSSLIVPILNANSRIQQVLVATGGENARTYLLDFPTAANSWDAMLQGFREATDSIAASSRDRVFAGPVRAIPVGSSVALVRTTYSVSATGSPAVAGISVLTGDTLFTAASLAQATRTGNLDGADRPLEPRDFRLRVEALYDAMRAALRRGDLAAFGEAFARLGALLEGVPR